MWRASDLSPEKGNALFLILIAVALFAALSYAVTQSSRGGGAGVDSEKLELEIARAHQYGTALRTAAMRMKLKGIPVASIVFMSGGAPCTSGSNCMFSQDGGGVAYQEAPGRIKPGGGTWVYNAGIGIGGIAPAANIRILFVINVDQDVCEAWNAAVGITGPIAEETDGVVTTLNAYSGEYAACIDITIGAGESYWLYYVIANE